ncbi:MAG: sialidase family protein [Thermoleophilaceae bacterium]
MRFSVRLAALAGALVLVPASAAAAGPQIATDLYANTTSQHATIVEPDSFSNGSTIMFAAQAGRFNDGGSSGIAWSTVDAGGVTSGTLPGLTTNDNHPGPYDRATDPSVAFDARDQVWLVSTLGLVNTSGAPTGRAVLTSRSTDATGSVWSNPVVTATASRRQDFDKNWIVCDNTSTSPHYGSCYTQFDDYGSSNALKMYYSRDGGKTWTASRVPRASIIGGQPLVLSNGNVVVPLDNASETAVGYTISTNGGVKFGSALTITSVTATADPGQIRSGPLPTAEIAGDDTIYLAWEDCRFRTNCATNDIVYVTSNNGTTWTAPKRVPISEGTSVDYFLPGIAVDRSSSGSGTRIGLVYYYETSGCAFSLCQLNVGYVSSADGGAHWSDTSTHLASGMSMSSLPNTTQGRMVGDYMSASFDASGNAHPAYVVASAPTGGSDCSVSGATCAQSLYSDALGALGGSTPPGTAVLFNGTVSQGASAFKRSQ